MKKKMLIVDYSVSNGNINFFEKHEKPKPLPRWVVA